MPTGSHDLVTNVGETTGEAHVTLNASGAQRPRVCEPGGCAKPLRRGALASYLSLCVTVRSDFHEHGHCRVAAQARGGARRATPTRCPPGTGRVRRRIPRTRSL